MKPTSLFRSLTGMLLLLLAPLLGLVTGLLVFCATALFVTAPSGLIVAGALALLLATAGLTRGGLALLGRPQATRQALWLAGIVTVLVGVASALTVFRPLQAQAPGPVPANVHFWSLPTGSRLAYVRASGMGVRRATPVLFLHGGPGTPGEGLPEGTQALTAAGFDVYAYDQLGSGRSGRLGDVSGYTVARQVADLEAVRVELGARQVILVGRSWGATLAAAYLAAHPAQVARVVFVSPAPVWNGAYPEGSVGGLAERLNAVQAQRMDALAATPRMLLHTVLLGVNPAAAHALVGDAEADTYMRQVMVAGKDAASCAGGAALRLHDNLPGYYVNKLTTEDARTVPDPRPALRRVMVPALVLRGECDFIHRPVAREYRQVLPRSVLVDVKGAGHALSSDQPALYTTLLTRFLQDQPLPLPDAGAAAPSAGVP